MAALAVVAMLLGLVVGGLLGLSLAGVCCGASRLLIR
jgi:hypothetical protein